MRETMGTTEPLPIAGQAVSGTNRPYLFVVLHCDQPTLGGARYDLSAIQEVRMGRGSTREILTLERGTLNKCAVSVPSSTVSKTHAQLTRVRDEWWIEDLGSKNGTCVNGVRIQKARVHDGDFIEIGSVLFRYRMVMTAAPCSDVDTAQLITKASGYASLEPTYALQLEALAQIARLQFTTLLLGETGTGKEVLANGTHQLSGRRGPLIVVNCGALPASLIESQLFGHVKGSFTGAQRDELGFVRSAEGGTLFLDEIGDLPLPAQAALLRVLQQREVIPVGGSKPTNVDVRFIAATNKPLDELCLRGEFRGDLLARLSTYKHTLPPLRKRMEDLGILIGDMLRRSTDANAMRVRISVTAVRTLLTHTWPHNIRELESLLGVAVALAGGLSIERFEWSHISGESPVPDEPPKNPADLRERIVALLQTHRGNATSVAKSMGKSRMQIYRWMTEFEIDPNDYRG